MKMRMMKLERVVFRNEVLDSLKRVMKSVFSNAREDVERERKNATYEIYFCYNALGIDNDEYAFIRENNRIYWYHSVNNMKFDSDSQTIRQNRDKEIALNFIEGLANYLVHGIGTILMWLDLEKYEFDQEKDLVSEKIELNTETHYIIEGLRKGEYVIIDKTLSKNIDFFYEHDSI